ncbi:MAG: rhomboid family intramembrane serine protease [Bdellovibrionota bacterium]
MNVPFDPIALTLVPSIAFAAAAMWHFCVLTKDHKSTWIAPGGFALLLGICGTFQAAALLTATPLDFVTYGAFYSPVAFDSEPWRIVSSIFLYDDPVIVLFTTLVIAIVGCRLSQHVGLRGVTCTFALASLAGTLCVVAVDAQALVVGATSGAFGLVTATLLFGGWQASAYVERIARATALSFVIVVLSQFVATDNMIGAVQAVGGILAALVVWATSRPPSKLQRNASMVGAFAIVASFAFLLPPATDLIGRAESTLRMERDTWARLAGLASARSKNWIVDGEFADRLESEVLPALDEIILGTASWGQGQTRWIVKERERLVTAHGRLAVLKEILRAKQRLIDAEASEDEKAREEKLDAFWKSLPDVKREISLISGEDEIRIGANYDLDLLRRTANDIEIWNLESALARLREQVVEDGPRTPASVLPWSEIRDGWLSRKVRLDRLSPGTPDQVTRIEALKERLARAIEAIE